MFKERTFTQAEWDALTSERDEARLKPNQRTWDLLRFCRSQLHNEMLITDEEYALLAEDHPAVNRLGDYDLTAFQLTEVAAELQRVGKEGQAAMEAMKQAVEGRMLAEASIAGAYREAAHMLDGKNGPFSPQLQEKILALTPAVAMRAEKLLVAQAKLEQAQKVITNWNIDESIRRFKVWADAEIADLTAALEEIKKERADADV